MSDELRAKIKKAQEELAAICKGKQFRMRIPVQPDDSDRVIGDGLLAGFEAIKETERMREEIEAAREFLERIRTIAEHHGAVYAAWGESLSGWIEKYIERLRLEKEGLVVENSQLDNDLIGARQTIQRLQTDLRDVKALLEASADYSKMLEQLIHDCGFDLYTQEGTRTGLRNRNTRMIYLPER